MFDLPSGIEHHEAVEEITSVLCAKTQNQDKGFFRPEVVYFLSRMASMMRTSVITMERGEIIVNAYVIAMASSGYGKGHSMFISEQDFFAGFLQRFMHETMPTIAETNLRNAADAKAAKDNTEPEDEYMKLRKEYDRLGEYVSSFDSGTAPAVKQLRQKLLISKVGAINTSIDEIGLNLANSTEILNLYLELYDQGQVQQKLTKNTAENVRSEERHGKTPTNLMMFGTPSRVFDGAQTEDLFYAFLDTGYARRCLYGFGLADRSQQLSEDPASIFARLTDPSNNAIINKWSNHFESLADISNFDYKIVVPEKVGVEMMRYKVYCEKQALALPEHAEIQRAELSHRYYKAYKVAGAFGFVDQAAELTMMHVHQAIKLVEESGESFKHILNREPTYAKLAKFIVGCGHEVTHADLTEALPYYKTSTTARNEIMSLAMAWGYKRHLIIKKTFVDGIEFFRGESLKETNVDSLILSHSDHYAESYHKELAPFDQLSVLVTQPSYNWCNHHFTNDHRREENVISGFNMIVVDIDKDAPLKMVQELMKEYKFMTYTTKRHQVEGHGDRFRLILPMNYELHLDSNEYREFFASFVSWLPFTVDTAANQRARKWETNDKAIVHVNEGKLLDVLQFIPKTSKNAEYLNQQKSVESMENLERWFAGQMQPGNRNNMMLRYAMTLVDAGNNMTSVMDSVRSFNAKLNHSLTEDELVKTIFTTVAKRYTA